MDDIARFGAYLSDEKHSSRNTVSSYLRDTTQFAEYLHNYCDIDLREADSAAVQDYMDWMLCPREVRRLPSPGFWRPSSPFTAIWWLPGS